MAELIQRLAPALERVLQVGRELPFWILLLLLLAALAFATRDVLRIDILPSVMLPGGSVRIRCHVPLDPRNRFLDFGLSDYTSHRVQIDGDKGPITSQWIFDKVPCDPGEAFCAVTRNTGDWSLVTAHLEVSCSDRR